MHVSKALTALVALPLICAAPQPILDADTTLLQRDPESNLQTRDDGLSSFVADISELWKRKGGGGGGGKGGGGSSSSGKGGSGSSSSGSSSSSSAGKGSSSSNTGGSTKTGSGVTPRFGGSYSGGSKSPYTSGSKSPSGISPVLLGAGVGAGIGLAAYPGYWGAFGAYSYPYAHPYIFHNRTATNSTATATATSASATASATNAARRSLYEYMGLVARQDASTGVNQSKPVTCLCAQYQECGCDDTGNTTFLDSIIGDGTYSSLNLSVVNVADINGTSTIILNGTLANGTTSSGGTENANAAPRTRGLEGAWVVVLLLGGMAALL